MQVVSWRYCCNAKKLDTYPASKRMPKDVRYGWFRHGHPNTRKYLKKQHTRRSRRYLKALLQQELLDHFEAKRLDWEALEEAYSSFAFDFALDDEEGETGTLREDEIDRELDQEFDDDWLMQDLESELERDYRLRYGGEELDNLDAELMLDLGDTP